MRQRVATWLVPLMLFLLPWQTRWIFGQQLIEGQAFEYGVMSVYAVQVLIVIAAVFLADGFRKTLGRSWKWIIVLWALFGVMNVFALNQVLAWMQFWHMTVAGLLFLLLLDERVSWRRCAIAFVVGLTAPLLLGFVQVLTGSSAAHTWFGLASRDAQQLGDAVVMVGGERVLRAYGSFPHPNVFGGYLAVCLLLTKMLYGKLHRFAPSFVTFLFLLGLGMTYSRSAILGVMIGFVWLFWAEHKKERTGMPWLRRSILMIGAVCLLMTPFLLKRVPFSNVLEQRSVVERIEQYQEWWDVFKAAPFIGHGMGNYTLALATEQPGQAWWEYQPVHNASFVALAEVGVFGVVILFTMCILVVRDRNLSSPLFLAPLIVLVPIDFLDHYLWTSWSGMALCAVVFATFLKEEKNKKTQLSQEGTSL
jgi:hypothetical protein